MAWEVAALRIGAHEARLSRLLYGYRSYRRPDASVELTFYFWVLRRGEQVVLVDTGFDEQWFARQGADLRWAVSPVDALAAIGIDPASVSTVVLTHLHFDHIGMVAAFPAAEYVVQQAEWAFWHGRLGAGPPMRAHTDVAALDHLDAAMRGGRVHLIGGDETLAEGLEVRLLAGHTPGQQGVIVDQNVVLAGDAAHLYVELDERLLFGTFTDAERMHATYEQLADYAERGLTVVPGHDPDVLRRFPPLLAARPDLGVRLDGASDGCHPAGAGAGAGGQPEAGVS